MQSLWKTVWRFFKTLKTELPYNPAILLLGIYPDKIIIQKDTCTPIFIAALFTIAKIWKQLKCPLTDECIKKMCIFIYTHTHHDNAICSTWIDLEIIRLSEVKSERERQIPYDIIYMWNLKYNTNELIYEIDSRT